MNYYYYLFYRIANYYNYANPKDSWIHAFLIIGTILLIHILTIVLFLSTFLDYNLVRFLDCFNPFVRRFMLLPILIFPIYLLIYLYGRLHSTTIKNKIANFKLESVENKRKGTRSILIYLIISLLFFFASITSPLWMK